jgi:hypothetical protein
MQVRRNCQVLSEQTSDSSAFLNAVCLLKYVLNYEKRFFLFSIFWSGFTLTGLARVYCLLQALTVIISLNRTNGLGFVTGTQCVLHAIRGVPRNASVHHILFLPNCRKTWQKKKMFLLERQTPERCWFCSCMHGFESRRTYLPTTTSARKELIRMVLWRQWPSWEFNRRPLDAPLTGLARER